MYIVGHFSITERSGMIAAERVYGDGAAALAFPDYALCHDWGYDLSFTQAPLTADGQLIRAHILGDWFIHFGAAPSNQQKVGWAYRRMGIYARRYHEFFKEAARLRLREDAPPEDSLRGFSHTMMEYTFDTFLAERGVFDSQFTRVQTALGSIGLGEGIGSRQWINDTIRRERVSVSAPDIDAAVASFRTRVSMSRSPAEFAYRAGCKKFGLDQSDESVAFTRRYIEDGLSEIPDSELSEVVSQASEFVGEWLKRLTPGEGGE
jgi:hypothetical protein